MSKTQDHHPERKPRRKRGRKTSPPPQAALTHFSGGRFQPLTQSDRQQIHQTTLQILDTVGLTEAPEPIVQLVVGNGGKLSKDNRLCFPESLVLNTLEGLKKDITLYGQVEGHELHLSGQKVYLGTGGAAPQLADMQTGEYRDTTLTDLYDAARLVDKLDNVHFFSRSVVARDMPDALSLDINTAYASLAGTTKHVMTSAANSDSVKAIAALCFKIAGSKEAFVQRPFLSLNINHAVSPMRFSTDALSVLGCAVAAGLPVHVNTFAQLGASSPVTIAGCIAQTMAETLAGMVIAWLVNPDVSAIFGPRPMVTDLRTGAMAGGGGEQALLSAAAVQMSQFYGLPNSTIAGATDSKIADAQSGYEKSLAVSLAAHSGCNLVTQACGMQAALMACSFESYIIDNDMLGAILRSLSPVEINSSTLSATAISEVVRGDGHYLGHEETLKRMQTDFLYPSVADRRDPEVWAAQGSLDIRTVAKQRAQDILHTHYPSHLTQPLDQELRKEHDIRLPIKRMQPQGDQ